MSGSVVRILDKDDLEALLARLPEDTYKIARANFRDATLAVQKAVVARLKGAPLQTRTGTLGRSILTQVRGNAGDLASLGASVYSTAKYAPIQEYGGTVRAKDKYRGVQGGPYLNIPTQANKTAAGVMRMGAREVFNAGGYVAPTSKSFGVYLDGRLMFVLVKQVEIPARLGMREEADAQVEPFMRRMNTALDNYLQRGIVSE